MLQLIYVSAALRGFQGSDLRTLLSRARRHNKASGISGLLVHRTRSLLHLIEGPDEEVEALFTRIQADPRHTALRVVERQAVAGREFHDWPLGFVAEVREGRSEGCADGLAGLEPVQVLGLTADQAKRAIGSYQSGKGRNLVTR